jgi:hypothetical protein
MKKYTELAEQQGNVPAAGWEKHLDADDGTVNFTFSGTQTHPPNVIINRNILKSFPMSGVMGLHRQETRAH